MCYIVQCYKFGTIDMYMYITCMIRVVERKIMVCECL